MKSYLLWYSYMLSDAMEDRDRKIVSPLCLDNEEWSRQKSPQAHGLGSTIANDWSAESREGPVEEGESRAEREGR
jgi:hypothetical protein